MFSSLIAPLDEQVFFSDVWEKKEYFHRSAQFGWSEAFISIDDLNEYLARNDLRYPCLRLAKDGKELPLSQYSKPLKFGEYAAAGLIQPDRLMSCYRDGATIVIQLAHESFPKLSKLAVGLERSLNFNVQMTVYLTPPNSQALTAHYDTHNVIICQLSGSKAWSVFGFEREAPLLKDFFDQAAFSTHQNGRPYDLLPGGLLYIPRGMVHSAAADAEPSLHLTIGLFPPLWIDLFHDHLNAMEEDIRFRRSPFWSATANEEKAELLKHFVESFSFEKLKEQAINKAITGQIQNHENRLLDTLALPSVRLETKFRVRSDLRWRMQQSDGKCVLRCFDKELRFDERMAPILETLLGTGGIFQSNEVDISLDAASKHKLCVRLLKEGLLTVS